MLLSTKTGFHIIETFCHQSINNSTQRKDISSFKDNTLLVPLTSCDDIVSNSTFDRCNVRCLDLLLCFPLDGPVKQRVWWDILITRILQYDFLNLPSKNQELKNWFTTDLFLYSIIIALYLIISVLFKLNSLH